MYDEVLNKDVYNTLLQKSLPDTKEKAEKRLPGFRLSLATAIVCLGGAFHFGFHLVITNPAQEAFIEFLNKSYQLKHGEFLERSSAETIWSLIVSVLFWGTVLGALFIQVVSERCGRKNGFLVAAFLQIIGISLAIASYYKNDYILYGLSRFILGVGISISLGIGPMFIAECSPKYCRGVISMGTGFTLQVAIVIGAVIAMPEYWGAPEYWWCLYASELVILVAVTLCTVLIPESPGYLVSRGKLDKALKSIVFYHAVADDQANELLDELKSHARDTQKAYGLLEVFSDPLARKGLSLGLVVMSSTIMSGIAVLNAFAVEMLMVTGLELRSAALANVAICTTALFGIFASSVIVEKYGRRPLLLGTFALITLSNVLISAFMYAFDATKNTTFAWLLVTTICLFMFVFASGPGPVAFFLTSELVDQTARGAAQTWVNLSMSIGRSILLAAYLPYQHLVGGPLAYLSLFVVPLIASLFYLFFHLPETKNKTIRDVQKEMLVNNGQVTKELRDATNDV